MDRFYWLENTDIRLSFEPLFPTMRQGGNADGLVDVMRQVGFDLRDAEDASFELHTESAFALAKHLTGVQLTADLLKSATYLRGTAPIPGR